MQGYFLDANLLVLLVVGSESRDIIPRHRRLEDYSAEDYDILLDLLRDADRLFVTPIPSLKHPISSGNTANLSVPD